MFSRVSDSNSLIDEYSVTHPRNLTRSKVRKRTLEWLGYNHNVLPDFIQSTIDVWHQGWESAELDGFEARYVTTCRGCQFGFTFNNQSCEIIDTILVERLDWIIEKVYSSISPDVHYSSGNIPEVVITPILHKNQIGPSSIDLRLSTEFKVSIQMNISVCLKALWD